MKWKEHFEKDIAYHALTAHEYDAVVVNPRHCLNDLLFESIGPLVRPGSRMLDLGCGTGHGIIRFGPKFDAVIGVDHSAEMLGRARSNLHDSGIDHGILLRQDLFAFLDGVVSSFDLITSIGCLHHLPPETLPELLKSANRCIADGGQLLIADPVVVDPSDQPQAIIDWNAASVVAGRAFSEETQEADEAPIDAGHLRDSLDAAGFTISRESRGWEVFPHHLPADEEDRRMIRGLHDLHGKTGNVLCMLCEKMADG